ncbi:hypothetical protein ACSBR2_033114 [Camellia fascicularis]
MEELIGKLDITEHGFSRLCQYFERIQDILYLPMYGQTNVAAFHPPMYFRPRQSLLVFFEQRSNKQSYNWAMTSLRLLGQHLGSQH